MLVLDSLGGFGADPRDICHIKGLRQSWGLVDLRQKHVLCLKPGQMAKIPPK